ncbi:hypothetical protein [Desertibaculum subflavum]|uniref:hypothetical protein n=1 Tax=Desertibaculum subflavum TaxID=2268458 RepID=UPI000E664893
MKHAGPAALDRIEILLAAIRALDGLVERSRGVFYRRGGAFLHFHEDPSGLHADLRIGAEFQRFRAESAAERRALLAALRRQLRPPSR